MASSVSNKRKSEGDGEGPRKIRKKFSDARKIDSPKITVKVGPQEKTFVIDEEKLKAHSDFFKMALNKEWKEGQERTVSLPDEEDPELFEIFALFIDTGDMYTVKEPDCIGEKENTEWRRLANLWALGYRLLSTSLRDAAIDSLIEKMVDEKRNPIILYGFIYRFSSRQSAARKLVVDIAIWFWDPKNLTRRDDLRNFPEFLLDLVEAFGLKQSVRNMKNPFLEKDGTGCRYHDHVVEGTPCYKTMF